jgi:SAM-dependent methyltransferase
MLVGNKCTAYEKALAILGRTLEQPPLGACMIPITESYLLYIKRGVRVLEIGCGSWSQIKDACESQGASYEGIDTQREYFGKKSVATRFENLADLSFPDEYFDLVIGSQTMEHWAEYGCRLSWGLYQCFRVAKDKGRVLLNVPIHFHGEKLFMLGQVEKIKNAFTAFSDQVIFDEWGKPSDPLPDLFPFPGFWVLKNNPAYVLDIQAVKDRPVPKGYSNQGAHQGKLAKIFTYPLSFLLYKLLRKLKVIGR